MRRLVALALALAGGLLPAPAAHAAAPAPQFLHVTAPDGGNGLPRVVDESGRTVLLRGVNVDGLVDYYRPDLRPPYPSDPGAYAAGRCPPDDPSVEGVRVCGFDFAQMQPLGYDAIRLNVSWSLLEPQPGTIDQTYVERIAQVVGWARAHGIYVVIDMHQDAWSKYVYSRPGDPCVAPFQATGGYDGAPLWASQHTSPACALAGVRELDPAVGEEFQRLYSDLPGPDGVGLQEHYANALLALARRFWRERAVAGYEIMNEPSPGLDPVPGGIDATELFPFYGKVVRTLTGALPRFRQLFFVEPNAERNVTDQRQIVTPWSAYSSYRNVVYAPHVYTGVFTADQEVASTRFLPNEGGYRSAIGDAQALGLPLWIGEYGNNPADDDTILRSHYELQDRFLLGGTLWLWKENANDVNHSVFWGVYGPPFGTGVPQPKRVRYGSRAYPLATAGRLDAVAYDPASGTFDIRASSAAVACGAHRRATVVYLPAASRAFGVTGARYERAGRLLYVYPRGGRYRVFGDAPAAMRAAACPARAARRAHRRRRGRHAGRAPRFTG